MKYRLPVLKIIADSFAITWLHKTTLLRVLAFPIFIIILFNITWSQIYTVKTTTDGLLLNMVYLLLLTFILINCHRVFLIGDDAVPKYGISINLRSLKFFAWAIILAVIFYISWYAFVIVFLNLFLNIFEFIIGSSDELIRSSKNINTWGSSFSKIFAFYILGRTCLVLPSVAIDGKPNLKWSWITTKKNGWRVFLLVGITPWVLTELIGLLYRVEPSVIEVIFLQIFSYLLVTVEVAFLSMTFKAFREANN